MYASWVRGEKPRRAMSRIMRVRSALMSHLHRGMGWRGFCATGARYIRKDDHTAIDINSERRLCRTGVRTYRVSGLVQLVLSRPVWAPYEALFLQRIQYPRFDVREKIRCNASGLSPVCDQSGG